MRGCRDPPKSVPLLVRRVLEPGTCRDFAAGPFLDQRGQPQARLPHAAKYLAEVDRLDVETTGKVALLAVSEICGEMFHALQLAHS